MSRELPYEIWSVGRVAAEFRDKADRDTALKVLKSMHVGRTLTPKEHAEPARAYRFMIKVKCDGSTYFPVGHIQEYSGDTALPGWAWCDGGRPPADADPKLAEILVPWGGVLPNLRDYPRYRKEHS